MFKNKTFFKCLYHFKIKIMFISKCLLPISPLREPALDIRERWIPKVTFERVECTGSKPTERKVKKRDRRQERVIMPWHNNGQRRLSPFSDQKFIYLNSVLVAELSCHNKASILVRMNFCPLNRIPDNGQDFCACLGALRFNTRLGFLQTRGKGIPAKRGDKLPLPSPILGSALYHPIVAFLRFCARVPSSVLDLWPEPPFDFICARTWPAATLFPITPRKRRGNGILMRPTRRVINSGAAISRK